MTVKLFFISVVAPKMARIFYNKALGKDYTQDTTEK